MIYKNYFKRVFDLMVVLVLGIPLFPIFLLVLVLLTINNSGSPFFFQKRPGLNGRIFFVIKFKTMNEARDASGNLLSDEERLTTLGSIIRKTSLDEIPQLINVLKGEMSLIGPRPLLTEYLPLYSALQARRHEVMPGITGWAQVNGRNLVNWKERFQMDVWYVDNIGFLLDLKIILLTVYKIFKSEGISSGTSATMEKFKGN
jgi:lipopolysaccharide/colanic/teichoic acid biosynthesis glycosyltransferase